MANTRVEQLDLFNPPKDILYEKIRSLFYNYIKDKHNFTDKVINSIIYEITGSPIVVEYASLIMKIGTPDEHIESEQIKKMLLQSLSRRCMFKELSISRQLKDFLKNLK